MGCSGHGAAGRYRHHAPCPRRSRRPLRGTAFRSGKSHPLGSPRQDRTPARSPGRPHRTRRSAQLHTSGARARVRQTSWANVPPSKQPVSFSHSSGRKDTSRALRRRGRRRSTQHEQPGFSAHSAPQKAGFTFEALPLGTVAFRSTRRAVLRCPATPWRYAAPTIATDVVVAETGSVRAQTPQSASLDPPTAAHAQSNGHPMPAGPLAEPTITRDTREASRVAVWGRHTPDAPAPASGPRAAEGVAASRHPRFTASRAVHTRTPTQRPPEPRPCGGPGPPLRSSRRW